MRTPIFVASLLMWSFFITSCQTGSETAQSQQKDIAIALTVPCDAADAASTAMLKLWSEDLDTIFGVLNVNACEVTGVVKNVPSGAARHIVIEVLDNDEKLLLFGSATIDVIPDVENEVNITLSRPTGTLVITGTMNTVSTDTIVVDDYDNVTAYVKQAPPFEPDDGTLALYHFDNLDDDRIPDVMEKNHATNNGATLEEGAFGKCLTFTATDFAEFDTIIPDGLEKGTIEFYLRFNDDFQSDNNYSLFGNDGSRIHFIYKNATLIFMKNHSSLFKFVTAPVSFEPGIWYRIAGIWGEGGMRLYVDYHLIGVNNDKSAYQSSPRGTEENRFYIGKKSSVGMDGIHINTSLTFNGSID